MRRISVLLLMFVVCGSARAACPSNVETLRPAILQVTGTPVAPICTEVSRQNGRVTAILFSNNAGMLLVTADAAGNLLHTSPEVMFGRSQALELLDLDRDGVPELVATGVAQNAVVCWVFSIDGAGQPRLLSLSSNDGPITDPEIVDLGAEGMLVIDTKEGSSVDENGERFTEWSYTPYKLSGGQLQADASNRLVSFVEVRRQRGKPLVETIDFAADNTSSEARLTLLNGAPDGHGRCSSGTLSVNGVQVISEAAFSQQVYRKDVPVALLRDNVMTAELRSGPECYVTLLINQHQ